MQFLRSVLFTVYLFVSAPLYSLVVVASAPLPHRLRFRVVLGWVDSVLWMLKRLCRLDHVVEGAENIPARNGVALWKHSSAWETIAQFRVFPPQCWVLKRELMWLPLVGWALRVLRPIAIDRRAGHSAVQQVLEQGRERLADGLWVVVFPEGTRVPAGQVRKYGISGALLAIENERPVVPVAHNAGYYWPRRGLLKRPGTIRVVIGPPIHTAGRDPREVNAEVRQWIEAQVPRITPGLAESVRSAHHPA